MAGNESESFRSLITGNKSFEVPPYQRNFSWEEEHVIDLWEDLVEAVEMKREHYIGTFLLMEQDESEEAVREIIDGQQRISTLILILFQIQKRLDEHGGEKEADIARRIRGEYIAKYGNQKLKLAGEDEDFFKEVILENVIDDDNEGQDDNAGAHVDTNTPSQTNLFKAKQIIDEKLDEGVPEGLGGVSKTEFFTKLYRKIQKLPLLEYTVESQSEAARIFQTINDRGKDLTDLEITKSYLMHRVSLMSDDDHANSYIETIQSKFGDMYDSVETISSSILEDNIQRYHFIMWNPDWGTGWNERYYQNHLKHIKDEFRSVDDPDEIMNYVHDLRDTFKTMEHIHSWEPGAAGSASDSLDEDTLRQIKRIVMTDRLSNFYPLIIVSLRKFSSNKISKKNFVKLLKQIESFIVRTYMIEQKSADTGRTKAYPLARGLFHNNNSTYSSKSIDHLDISEVISRMESYTAKYCNDDQVRSTLGDENVYERYDDSNRLRELRLLLLSYERTLDREENHFSTEEVVRNKGSHYTIEHVWPKNPGDAFIDSNKEHIKGHTHRLGNLSLMDSNDQPIMGNMLFEDKKDKFKNSKIRMFEEVFDHDTWSEDIIESRENDMIEAIIDRWPVN